MFLILSNFLYNLTPTHHASEGNPTSTSLSPLSSSPHRSLLHTSPETIDSYSSASQNLGIFSSFIIVSRQIISIPISIGIIYGYAALKQYRNQEQQPWQSFGWLELESTNCLWLIAIVIFMQLVSVFRTPVAVQERRHWGKSA